MTDTSVNNHHKASSEERLDRIVPRIAVVGVGGAGGNAVDNMIRSNLQGVTFLVCNTDAQALSQSLCPESQRVRLGFGVTQGLGAGSSPDVGKLAAEESVQDVMQHLKGVHMVFITAGMGGGTGTGAAPVLAKAAKELGILTVGVVTKPFHFEGTQRMRAAEKGIEVIRTCVDTLLIIPNQNLFRLANQNTTFVQAFAMADDVLHSGVRTFTDLMINPGLVNCDFADIGTVMRNTSGKTLMGAGEASGESRGIDAAEKAIGSLLLDDVSITGAQSVLINVTGGADLKLYDVDEAIGRIKQEVDHEMPGRDLARIIFGATFDQNLEGSIRVSVVATGIQDQAQWLEVANHLSPKTEDLTLTADTFATVGSRHQSYDFDDTTSGGFSSFALQEDAEDEFGQDTMSDPSQRPWNPHQHTQLQNAQTTGGFFQRLLGGLGRKKDPIVPLYPDLNRQDKVPPARSGTTEEGASDIPLFLKKKPK